MYVHNIDLLLTFFPIRTEQFSGHINNAFPLYDTKTFLVAHQKFPF